VNVPRELYDPEFPTEDYGYTVAHFLPGEQVMDGARALMYSRIRHPDSDFERMRRQQAVVVGIAERLRERGVLKNLREVNRITTALRPYIHTDIPRPLALNLLWSIRSVDVSMVKKLTVDTSLLTETSMYGAYAIVAEPSTLHELGAQFMEVP
jgi:anionic cell wall polymer biosynthesis LytR-Cps2A-Psr (LCP) family protein